MQNHHSFALTMRLRRNLRMVEYKPKQHLWSVDWCNTAMCSDRSLFPFFTIRCILVEAHTTTKNRCPNCLLKETICREDHTIYDFVAWDGFYLYFNLFFLQGMRWTRAEPRTRQNSRVRYDDPGIKCFILLNFLLIFLWILHITQRHDMWNFRDISIYP